MLPLPLRRVNRLAILEHVAAHDMIASTRALSIALGRGCSGFHADVAELAMA